MTWRRSQACVSYVWLLRMGHSESQLQKKTCVFIRGIGALCLASDPEEAEAVAMVLEKNCLAYAYGRRQGEYAHLGLLDAALQRNTYVKKYSKLK